MSEIKVAKLTTEELKAELKRRKADDLTEQKARKKEYEKKRDTLITNLMEKAQAESNALLKFKQDAFAQLKEFYREMLEYGQLRGGENNKGSFTVFNENQDMKIIFSSQIVKGFDERADTAAEHLRAFAEQFVKKKDERTFKLLMTSLERNSRTQKLDVGQVSKLYKLENDFADFPQFSKAIQLFKESYTEIETAHYARFYSKNEAGTWIQVSLDFASI